MDIIRRKKLSSEVVDRLIAAISSSEFPPGSQMPSERELMLRLGVGRPVVREAMQKLEQMGLLRISHGERARVVNPSPDDIIERISDGMFILLNSSAHGLQDLKEARLLVETGLVKIAVKRATSADLEKLGRIHREIQTLSSSDEQFVAKDMEFHVAIAEISGNQLFAAVLRGMLVWIARFRREWVSVRGADRITIEEHEKIYRAILAGDEEAAATAVGEHLRRANALYSQFLPQV